jgi:hypothetical protein
MIVGKFLSDAADHSTAAAGRIASGIGVTTAPSGLEEPFLRQLARNGSVPLAKISHLRFT